MFHSNHTQFRYNIIQSIEYIFEHKGRSLIHQHSANNNYLNLRALLRCCLRVLPSYVPTCASTIIMELFRISLRSNWSQLQLATRNYRSTNNGLGRTLRSTVAQLQCPGRIRKDASSMATHDLHFVFHSGRALFNYGNAWSSSSSFRSCHVVLFVFLPSCWSLITQTIPLVNKRINLKPTSGGKTRDYPNGR